MTKQIKSKITKVFKELEILYKPFDAYLIHEKQFYVYNALYLYEFDIIIEFTEDFEYVVVYDKNGNIKQHFNKTSDNVVIFTLGSMMN